MGSTDVGINGYLCACEKKLFGPRSGIRSGLRVCETERGVLEGEVNEDGFYLCYAWTGKQQKGTGVDSLDCVLRITKSKGVEEARDYFAGLTFGPFNWVFADKAGNIGYQLGGLVPKQPEGSSGLLPYLGWDETQNWDGMVDPKLYPRHDESRMRFYCDGKS